MEVIANQSEDQNDSLIRDFNIAANHIQILVPQLDNDTLLLLYGYYKQGTQGICNTPKPSWFDYKSKAKWNAWHNLGHMSSKEAQQLYIELVKKLDNTFDPSNDQQHPQGWVSVSKFLQNDDGEVATSLIDFVKEGNPHRVREILMANRENAEIDHIDDKSGMALVHWAADRGSIDVLNVLLEFGANVNLQDASGQTALHYASSCGHADCIQLLLNKNADPNIIDNDGYKPSNVAENTNIKELLSVSVD